MTDRLRIALAQLNPRLGAVAANANRIRAARAEAAALGATLLVTPHFSLGGFPPEALARHPATLTACEAMLQALAAETADGGPGLVVGGPWTEGGRFHDAAFLLDGGRVVARRAGHEVPAGGFDPGPAPGPVVFRGCRLGLMIGADGSSSAVAETLAESGAEILLCLDAGAFFPGAPERRIDQAVARVVETGLPLMLLAPVGGQGELVCDGGGFVLNADRSLALRQPSFAEAVTPSDWTLGAEGWFCAPQPLPTPMPAPEQLWRALMLGLADHVGKNGFSGVLLALSGDAGSALTAACAVDALGADRVRAVSLQAGQDSPGGLEDAMACAALLGIRLERLPLAPALAGFETMLGGLAADHLFIHVGAAALGALADASGELVLDSTDRSDLLAGPPRLQGGFSLLRDVWKTAALELACWRNARRPDGALGPAGPVMPAHLAAGAGAEGGLPAPGILDPLLRGLVEEGLHPDMLVARGFDRDTVGRVWRLLDRAGYKRRQAPPGVALGRQAFGRDRRDPLFHGFTDLLP
jgi:NAD+ synthase